MPADAYIRLDDRVPSVVNPFVSTPFKYTPLAYTKMAIVGVTLFPLRLAVLIGATAVGAITTSVLTLGADLTKPLPPLRRLLISGTTRLTARAGLWALGYWWITVDKRPGSGGAHVLVAAPHYSLLDAFFFGYYEAPSAISKAAVKHIPIIGTLAMAVQTIFVDRKDPQARSKAAAALKERGSAAGAAAGWPPVLIFPEGTCTNGQALISFKAGAFAIGAPVQPVVLRYPHAYCDPSAADTGYDRLLLLMLQVYNRLEVTYLPVVAPTAAEQADAKLFASAVRALMAKELGVGQTQHSYSDVWLSVEAAKVGVAQDFEMARLEKLFNLSVDDAKRLLASFHRLDGDGSGRIELDEFAAALGLQDAPAGYVQRLFSFFDADGAGDISFAELVQGLAVLSPSCSMEEKLKLAFLTCDMDASGGVSAPQPAGRHRVRRRARRLARRRRVGGGAAPGGLRRAAAARALAERPRRRARRRVRQARPRRQQGARLRRVVRLRRRARRPAPAQPRRRRRPDGRARRPRAHRADDEGGAAGEPGGGDARGREKRG